MVPNLLDLTDNNGYFNLTDAPSGLQKLMITYVGYDTLIVDIDVKNLAVTYKKLYIETSTQLLDEVQITAGA